MGVDSGLPDFRGEKGFWNAYPVVAGLGYSFSEMAQPRWFITNPRLAWAFYGHRLNLYRKTQPHAGFKLLLDICKRNPLGYFVFTSNVDGQFQKAGYDHNLILECHGSIHHFQCSKPCSTDIWAADDSEILIDEDAFQATGDLPACPKCGAIARPNIMMFGDGQWIEKLSEQQAKRLSAWKMSLKGSRYVIIEIGMSSSESIYNGAFEESPKFNNPTTIIINPKVASSTHLHHMSLPMGGLDAISSICKLLQNMGS
jgi:NAD-dependent SIR2 family protein deacetylase